MVQLDGARVLITGGSSGIGLATAHALAGKGARVVLAARNQERLDRARDAVTGSVAVQLDVADPSSLQRGADEALASLGGLDVLINNAGIPLAASFADTDDEAFMRVLNVNLVGAVRLTRALLPPLKRSRGHIVFVSSLAGLLGVYGYTAYATSKFGMSGFAECLRQELIEHDVGVSVIYPPDTDTPMLTQENETKPAVTAALTESASLLSADHVAASIVAAVVNETPRVVPGGNAKLTDVAARVMPNVTRWVMDRMIKNAQKR